MGYVFFFKKTPHILNNPQIKSSCLLLGCPGILRVWGQLQRIAEENLALCLPHQMAPDSGAPWLYSSLPSETVQLILTGRFAMLVLLRLQHFGGYQDSSSEVKTSIPWAFQVLLLSSNLFLVLHQFSLCSVDFIYILLFLVSSSVLQNRWLNLSISIYCWSPSWIRLHYILFELGGKTVSGCYQRKQLWYHELYCALQLCLLMCH